MSCFEDMWKARFFAPISKRFWCTKQLGQWWNKTISNCWATGTAKDLEIYWLVNLPLPNVPAPQKEGLIKGLFSICGFSSIRPAIKTLISFREGYVARARLGTDQSWRNGFPELGTSGCFFLKGLGHLRVNYCFGAPWFGFLGIVPLVYP